MSGTHLSKQELTIIRQIGRQHAERFATVTDGNWKSFNQSVRVLAREMADAASQRGVKSARKRLALAELQNVAMAERARLTAAMPAMRGNA